MFEVGQSVVCVDGRRSFYGGPAMLTKGAIYTIKGFDSLPPDDRGNAGVFLVEVEPASRKNIGWASSRFRPVTRTRDTLSIESFMTIKTGQPEGPRRVVGPVSPKRERV